MADPVSASVIGAGALMGAGGNFMANMAQADAEERNAQWLDEQARFAEKAGKLAYDVRSDELAEFRGQQITAFAGSGFSFEAEEGRAMAETDRRIARELEAIRAQTQVNVQEARLKSRESRMKSNNLRDPLINSLQIGGSLLGGAGSILRSK